MGDRFHNLPKDLQTKIYSADPTYREVFDKSLDRIKLGLIDLSKYEIDYSLNTDTLLREKGTNNPVDYIKIADTSEYEVFYLDNTGLNTRDIDYICQGALNADYVQSKDELEDSYGLALYDKKDPNVEVAFIISSPTFDENTREVLILCARPGNGRKRLKVYDVF